MKKVLLISGSLPPIRCGVGYYTARLCRELKAEHLDFEVLSTKGVNDDVPAKLLTIPNWKIRSLPKILAAIKESGAKIIHIQYPAVGYGRQLGINLLPHLLRILRPRLEIIVTLHEYHGSRRLGRWRDLITVAPAQKIVISNQADRSALPNWLARKSKLIPIGSNLEKVSKNPKVFADIMREHKLDAKKPTILFFGFAYPAKGLENLLKAMSQPYLADWQLLLLSSLDKNDAYHKSLLNQIEDLNRDNNRIAVAGFLPDEQVSAILQEGRYFVLPQSMPVTAKSGTAIAAAQHNLIMISCGGQDPELSMPFKHLANCFLATGMTAEFIANAIEQLENSSSSRQIILDGSKKLEQYFSWPHIVDEHLKMYGEA